MRLLVASTTTTTFVDAGNDAADWVVAAVLFVLSVCCVIVGSLRGGCVCGRTP